MPGVSKVEYFGRILLDLTGDSITAETMLKGITAHDKTGALIEGLIETVTQATPEISVSSSGLITASATQEGGLVSSGTKSATKQLTTKGATTVTPSSSVQTVVSAGTYVTGDIKVAAASSAKIKTGSFTPSSAVATQTVTHSLGVVPNFGLCMISGTSNPSEYWNFVLGVYYKGIMAAFRDSSNGDILFSNASITGGLGDSVGQWLSSATTSSIKFGNSNTSAKFAATTYNWVLGSI